MAKRATGLVLAALSWAALLSTNISTVGAAGPDPSFLSTSSVRQGLQGTTRDAAGRLLPFVEVRVLSPMTTGVTTLSISRVLSEQAISTVRSDAVGRFFVGGLLPGSYRLLATKGGYTVVIGQINTLLSASIDLVLHPAGPAGAPGTRPDDTSWVLRLPERDRLEQESYRVDTKLAGARQQRIDLPVRVDISHTSISSNGESGNSGSGIGIGLSAGWPLADGVFRADARYRQLGGDGDLEDESHAIGAHWDGSPYEGVTLAVSLTTEDWNRQFGDLASDTSFVSDQRRDGVQVAGSVVRDGARHEWRAEFDRLMSDEPRLPGSDEVRLARWASARWSMEQTFGEHTLAIRALGRSAGGAWQEGEDGRAAFATIAAVVPSDAGSLGSVSGGAVDVAVADAWAAAPGLTVTGRTRAEYAGGFDDGVRAGLSGGAAWQAAPWLDVRAEAGLTGGAGSSSIWSLQWAGVADRWSWSLSRSRESSVAPWSAQGAYEPASERWITDRAGVIGKWVASVERAGRGRAPALSLRIERYEVDGRLVARLARDRATVPIVDDASGLGRQLQLGVSFPTTGTSLAIHWNEIEDQRGPGDLLGGVSAWRQTTVSVRQQLAALSWHGASTHLLISLDDGRSSGSIDPSKLDAARVALLDQRRLSGGLALSF